MRALKWSLLIAVAALCAGCLKEEIPVPLAPRGDAAVYVARVGPDYANQVWFNLNTGETVSRNTKMDWDLAFECAPEGWLVRLNFARLMQVHQAAEPLEQPTDTTGYGNTWRIDLPSGAADSVAMGGWRTDNPVFVLDMGYDMVGMHLGLRKIQIMEVSATQYVFRTARMNGADVQTWIAQKDPQRAYAHFSFTSGGMVQIAPPLGTYDMVFTQYTEQFYPPDPYEAYIVTGAVNGFSGVRVARLTGDLQQVTLADTLQHPFTSDQDAIGYDWKKYSFDTGQYEVFSDQVYIVHSSSGFFYKLHFVDYYDEDGLRGSPKFEVVPL